MKNTVLLLIFAISLFGQIIGSDFLKIEKDKLIITDETKFAAYLKSLDDKDIMDQYKEILKPIDLFGEAQASLIEVTSYEQAFRNIRYIYSKLYLEDKPQNIDRQMAALRDKQAKIISLLLSLQVKNLYDTDVIPIIFEYRRIDRKLLELEIEKNSLIKSKNAIIDAIIKKNLRFDSDALDLRSKIESLKQRVEELKKEKATAKSDAKKESIAIKISLLSLRLQSYEMKSDFFEKIRLLKKIKSSKDATKEKQKLDSLLSKSYEPIYLGTKEVTQKNSTLLAEYESEKAAFEALREETKLDSMVFERVLKSFDDSLPARTTGYFESAYNFLNNTIDTTLYVSNNIDIKVKTVIFVLITVILIYIAKVWIIKKAIPAYFGKRYKDGSYSEHIQFIVSKIANIVAYIIMFFAILSGFGLSLTNFAIIVSALSVGIGFGLQGVVSNFISGIILLFENSIKIGDIIQLEDGRMGVVTSVNLRTTNIRTFDDVDILIPNASVFSGKIENLTKESSVVRKRVFFGVGYDTDFKRLKEILDAKTKELMGEFFIEPTKLLINKYDASSAQVEYRIFVDIKKIGLEVGDFLKEFLDELKANDIEIPYPKLEIIKSEGDKK